MRPHREAADAALHRIGESEDPEYKQRLLLSAIAHALLDISDQLALLAMPPKGWRERFEAEADG